MPSSKRIVHVISHTHWDREWYMPYEAHHVKLIETMDTLLRTFESDPEFRSFYLDGQTIVLDDYLQVYPEKREQIQKLCDEGKLSLGPWYILQDEFLTSSEANVRNLQIGHRDAAKFGPISKLGYFPDSFGNMGQAAQLLKQAGIDTAVFGRGVKATGFNNRVDDSGLESPFSELIWQSPDGSSVLGLLFANWYNNGMEIPVDPTHAKPYWDHRLARAEQFASTRHLLLMNGCDHQPVQTNLSEALRIARELFPDYEFVHSNFDDYVKAVEAERPDTLSVTRGELRGQQTDGWYSLVNTASARVYIKQLNQQNQTLLEKVAEPLAAAAHQLGKPYPHGLMQYAWKTLMQNHPHDSICGCSVDEVYDEMKTRFAKSMEVGKRLTEDSVLFIGSKMDTSFFASYSEEAVPLAVFNTSGYEGSSVVTMELEFAHQFFDQSEDPVAIAAAVKARTHAEGYLIDAAGTAIAHTAQDLGVRFGYELPNDKFRQPYMARAIRLTFEATDLPQLGYNSYAWIPTAGRTVTPAPTEEQKSLLHDGRVIENRHLKLTVHDDGSYSVYHKTSGQTFSGLGVYEDVGDIGNEYIFKQPAGDAAITTKGLKAAIRVVEDTPYRATIEIIHSLAIPVGADDQLAQEVNSMVEFRSRKAGRSSELAPLVIVTRLSVDRNGKGIRVHAAINNASKDHRVRVLMPSDAECKTHYADSIFEVAERQTVPSSVWENPSNCQHLQTFIDVHDHARGLTAAGKGLNEYEVLQDGRNTIALTLLRSVGELGDWGVFPTPDAQCLGNNIAEWMIIPYGGDSERFDAYREAYRFPVPLTATRVNLQQGELPLTDQFLAWNGENLAFSSLKINEERGDLMARWYNLSGEPSTLAVQPNAAANDEAYLSNIMEDAGDEAEATGSSIPVEGYKIVTVGFKS
ncbi:alpha-mannosidase [Paenibacillus glycanilyticus]|uniref:Alpha-mannosidase n=1 Tax=Paenibacillus glycanilyticus TaxID=126569 RepID=A0ABQ6GCE9_9BACL|nr:alpha-mannosidase [Paenibacillus glycanilyticus]GLX67750.1 alpha-mannosidase [Paenibacillus glycanilyticus]